jgi:plasmid maintenance system antidote protein VapI
MENFGEIEFFNPKLTDNNIKNFWKNVIIKNNSCWRWIGCSNKKTGRGQTAAGGVSCQAPRLAYFLEYGKFNKSLYVCHDCDNPNCVNPEHLFLGTSLENTKDRYIKGRGMKSEDSPTVKISMDIANSIRKDYLTGNFEQKNLCEKYGVSIKTISDVIRNKRWINPDYIYKKITVNLGKNFKTGNLPWQKLNKENVEEIRTLISNGVKDRKIAELFGVSRRAITKIKLNETWRMK